MAKERRFEKRGYLRYIRQTADGSYVYTGGYYALAGGGYGALLRRVFALVLPAAACEIAFGVLPNPAMTFGVVETSTITSVYVVIPYLLAFALTGSVTWAALRLFTNEKPLREYIYKVTIQQLPVRCILASVSAGAVIAGETVFLILHGAGGQTGWVIAAYGLQACALALPLFLRAYIKNTEWNFSAEKKQ